MNMPQVGRQDRQAALDILTGPIPLDQGFHGKPVTKIVKTRSMTIRRATQSDLPRQGVKRAPDLGAVQPRPTPGYEKGFRSSRQKTIPPGCIVGEHLSRRGMNGYETGFAELAPRMVRMPFFRSTSSVCRLRASLMRRPVTASNPSKL